MIDGKLMEQDDIDKARSVLRNRQLIIFSRSKSKKPIHANLKMIKQEDVVKIHDFIWPQA